MAPLEWHSGDAVTRRRAIASCGRSQADSGRGPLCFLATGQHRVVARLRFVARLSRNPSRCEGQL